MKLMEKTYGFKYSTRPGTGTLSLSNTTSSLGAAGCSTLQKLANVQPGVSWGRLDDPALKSVWISSDCTCLLAMTRNDVNKE